MVGLLCADGTIYGFNKGAHKGRRLANKHPRLQAIRDEQVIRMDGQF
jgi:hypothetical protein